MFRLLFSKASAGQGETTYEMVWYRRKQHPDVGEAGPKCVEACRYALKMGQRIECSMKMCWISRQKLRELVQYAKINSA